MQYYNKNRIQLNLILGDANLYSYLLDMKGAKKLAPFVINLLSAYYYDTRVQEAYENYVNGGMQEEVQADNTVDYIADAQKNLFAMSVITEAMRGTVEGTLQDSMAQVKSILSDKEGVLDNTDFGEPLAKLSTGDIAETAISNKNSNKEQSIDNDRISKLEEQMNTIMEMLSNLTVNNQVNTKQVSQVGNNAEPIIEPVKPQIDKVYTNPVIQPIAPIVKEESKAEVVVDDNKDELDALMNSF